MTFQSPALEPNDIPDSSAPSEKTTPSSNAWLRSHHQAAIDFRKRWRSCAFWWLATFWFGGLIFGLFALSTAGTVFLGSYLPCLPDGSFAVDPSTFRYFSSSGFFEITMAFGKMTFTQAKAIDVVWDIVVGRGGQAMIVFVSWRVFANYVTTSMEVAPITFRTYRAVFLPGGSLLSGIPNMIYDFATRHGLHSKIAMVFMIYTMIFALIYPTIAGAMAGYNGNVQAFVNTTDSNYVPFRSFEYAFFVIHDGERIGKGNEYVITDTLGSRGEPPAEPTIYGQGFNTLNCFASFYAPYHPEACYVQSNVSSYILNYGLNGKNNTNTTFMGIDLPPPALNISAFYLPERIYNSVMPMNLRTTTTLQRYNDTSPITWYYGNVTYTQAEMQHRGKCQALLDYQWGFSFVQLFIMLILCIIWTIGIYTMWLRAHVLMRRRGRTEIAGDHLAILELADAMRNQGLDIHNNTSSGGNDSKVPGDVAITVTSTGSSSSSANMPPTYEFTESTLRNRVAADLRGGSISYITPLLSNGGEESRDWNILGWLLRNKFSILGMAICIAASMTSGVMLAHYIMILVPLPLELGTALYIGSTRGSRIVVFYQALLVCSVLPQVVAIICTVLYRKPY